MNRHCERLKTIRSAFLPQNSASRLFAVFPLFLFIIYKSLVPTSYKPTSLFPSVLARNWYLVYWPYLLIENMSPGTGRQNLLNVSIKNPS